MFIALLLGVTLGASTVVFAVVDSLVFRPAPYPDVDRVVALNGAVKSGEHLGRLPSARLYDEWRAQHDLFAAVGGFLTKTVFVAGRDASERPFRFDTGPSLITLPQVFEQLFADVGEDLHAHLKLVRLDPIHRYVWPDGATFTGDVASFAPETSRTSDISRPTSSSYRTPGCCAKKYSGRFST